VSLRRDQLIPVNKAVNKKEQLEKGLEEEEEKKEFALAWRYRKQVGCEIESGQGLGRSG
jgi:hypothetical protein